MDTTQNHSGMRETLDRWKSLGTDKVHEMQRTVAERGLAVKSLVRDRTNESITRVNSSMRGNPMKWAGIAAGTGFTLGMIGRLLDRRRHHRHHHQAQLVIIDAC